MSHARTQIRDAVVTALTSLTTTAGRVYPSRVYALADNELPGLCVYTIDEDSAIGAGSRPRTMHRNMHLGVDAYVKGTGSVDDSIDQICSEVEAALGNTKPVGVKDLFLASTRIRQDGQGSKPAMIAVMTFEISFQTKENAPNSIV